MVYCLTKYILFIMNLTYHEILDYLNQNEFNWVTVLFDNTYNDITIYGALVGLKHAEHLGDDYEEWLYDYSGHVKNDDLFTYVEMQGAELKSFIDTHTFNFALVTE